MKRYDVETIVADLRRNVEAMERARVDADPDSAASVAYRGVEVQVEVIRWIAREVDRIGEGGNATPILRGAGLLLGQLVEHVVVMSGQVAPDDHRGAVELVLQVAACALARGPGTGVDLPLKVDEVGH